MIENVPISPCDWESVWVIHMPTVGNSSVGMAKAALEVVNGVNLFGKHGAHWSVIFVDIDAHYRNRTTVDSILARESASKVVRRRNVVPVVVVFGGLLLSV